MPNKTDEVFFFLLFLFFSFFRFSFVPRNRSIYQNDIILVNIFETERMTKKNMKLLNWQQTKFSDTQILISFVSNVWLKILPLYIIYRFVLFETCCVCVCVIFFPVDSLDVFMDIGKLSTKRNYSCPRLELEWEFDIPCQRLFENVSMHWGISLKTATVLHSTTSILFSFFSPLYFRTGAWGHMFIINMFALMWN